MELKKQECVINFTAVGSLRRQFASSRKKHILLYVFAAHLERIGIVIGMCYFQMKRFCQCHQ